MDARFIVAARRPTGSIARCGFQTAIQLPITRVTSGWSADARPVAQRYHFPHSPFELQERGMQRGLTKGTTAQPCLLAVLRTGGIHICACESPITTRLSSTAAIAGWASSDRRARAASATWTSENGVPWTTVFTLAPCRASVAFRSASDTPCSNLTRRLFLIEPRPTRNAQRRRLRLRRRAVGCDTPADHLKHHKSRGRENDRREPDACPLQLRNPSFSRADVCVVKRNATIAGFRSNGVEFRRPLDRRARIFDAPSLRIRAPRY
jgi:hypothetical protein